MSCGGCYYHMQGEKSPTGESWCGWMGGDPDPGNPKRCRPKPLEQQRLPEGLVIARSRRLVPVDQLADENEAHRDAVGDGGWRGY